LRKGALWGALFLCLAAPAAAEERTLATGQVDAEVKAYGGVAIFSRWDGAAYSLVASTAGGPLQPLAVPPQSKRFDADIGPGPDGRPTVVLRQCVASGCGLSLLALDGTAPVPTGLKVPRATVHPTLWHRTIAWLDHGRIRTRDSLIARVKRTTDVLALELYGRRLALAVADATGGGVCGRREIRLMNIRSGKVRVLGSQLCGLNGQTFHGPTFAAGWLYFARSCNLACGATRYGAFRYRLRDGRYEIAGDGRPIAGWAWGGGGSAYQLRAVSDVGCSDPAACTLVWTDGLQFKRVGAPIHQ